MLSASTALVLALATVVMLFAVQPLLLKAACSMTGVRSPGLLKAAGVVLAAFVVSLFTGVLWAATGGLLLSFVSTPLAALSGVVVSWLTIAVVYSATLRIGMGKAFQVSTVAYVGGLLLTAVVVGALRVVVAVV